MTIKPDYIIRDNILVPDQLQIVDAGENLILASINASTDRGKYLVASMFIGFDKLGLKAKDETRIIEEAPEPEKTAEEKPE